MKNGHDCKSFRDRLESSRGIPVADDDLTELKRLSGDCPDCSVLLRIHLDLHSVTMSSLEESVPDEMVDTMWIDVSRDLGRVPHYLREGRAGKTPLGRLVPAMAAVLAVLLFAGGFLLSEVERLKKRERILTSRLEKLESPAPISPPEGSILTDYLIGRRFAGIGYSGLLGGREDFTVAELSAIIEGLPSDYLLLGPVEAERLFHRAGGFPLISLRFPRFAIDPSDGIQPAEAIGLIRAMSLDTNARITRNRILDLIEGRSPAKAAVKLESLS